VRKTSPIRRILVESALIVFSILVALAANQWNDSRKQHVLTERALRGIRDEIVANANRLRKSRPYHYMLEGETRVADSLKRVHSYADFKAAAPNWSGFQNATLESTAWQSAITLGTVTNIGYDTVTTLSGLYALQAKFDQYASDAVATFDFADQTMPSTVRKMWVYFVTVRTNEDTLLNRYSAALSLLGRKATP
jgi:hypothetical protein